MRKRVTFIVLWGAVFLGSSASVACNLESVRFGSNEQELWNNLLGQQNSYTMGDEQLLPIFELMLPGELVCERDKYFEGVPVEYQFLYGKLVEIRLFRLSDKPVLLDWVEGQYGVIKNKPQGIFSSKPNGHLVWDSINSVVSYLYNTQGGDRVESVIIQSKNHTKLFERFYREEELALESGTWSGEMK